MSATAPRHRAGSPRKASARRFAIAVSLGYFAFAALWIAASDAILRITGADPHVSAQLQLWKGWFFVGMTSVLLFTLLARRNFVAAQPSARPSRRFTWLVASSLLLVVAVVISAFFLSLAGERDQALEQIARMAESRSRLLGEQAGRAMDKVWFVLKEAARDFEDEDETRGELRASAAQQDPIILALRILDSSGKVRAQTDGPTGESSHFQHAHWLALRDGASPTYLNRPADTRAAIEASVRLQQADGRFAGVAIASLNRHALLDDSGALPIGAEGLLGVLRLDGTVLLLRRAPANAALTLDPGLLEAIHGRASGAYRSADGDHGPARIYSFSRVKGHDLLVIAGLGVRENLAGWRANLDAQVAIAALFVALTALLGALFLREWGRRQDLSHAAEESAGRYRRVAELLPDAILTIQDGRIVYANDAAGRLLDAGNPKALIGTQANRFIAPRFRKSADAQIMELLNSRGNAPPLECALLRSDGTEIEVELSSAYVDRAGHPGVIVIARDVGERRRREDQLKTSEARYRTLVDTADEGIWEVDGANRTTFVNARMAQMLGYAVAEMTGRLSTDFLWPSTVQSAQGKVARLQRTERLDRCYLRKDGSALWASAAITPLFDAAGRLTGRIAMVTDITERKVREDRLRASEASLAAAQHIALLGSWERDLADPSGSVQWSDEMFRIFGCDPQRTAVTVGSFLDMVHPEDRERAKEALSAMMANSGTRQLEHRIVRLDGVVRTVRQIGLVLPDETGAPARMLGTVQDITEQELHESHLREANERLEALSERLMRIQEDEKKALAHELHDEFGQMLTAISLQLHALFKTTSHPKVDQSLQMIDRALDQVRSLSLDLRPAHLDRGLAVALEFNLARLASQSGEPIHFEASPGFPLFAGPRADSCYRLAQEAVTNAVRHARAEEIDVRLAVHEDRLVLEVEDDGVGFDMQSKQARSGSGRSLGLIGMQERARMLGGSLEIRSVPGQGTLVAARIPIDAQDRAHA